MVPCRYAHVPAARLGMPRRLAGMPGLHGGMPSRHPARPRWHAQVPHRHPRVRGSHACVSPRHPQMSSQPPRAPPRHLRRSFQPAGPPCRRAGMSMWRPQMPVLLPGMLDQPVRMLDWHPGMLRRRPPLPVRRLKPSYRHVGRPPSAVSGSGRRKTTVRLLAPANASIALRCGKRNEARRGALSVSGTASERPRRDFDRRDRLQRLHSGGFACFHCSMNFRWAGTVIR